MSTPAQPIFVGPREGECLSAAGDVYRLLARGDQTGGAYVLCEARVLPGGGPPPHIHQREEEGFFILEGEITFQLGDRRLAAAAGSFVQGPRGIPHSFKNEGSVPARMLIFVTPAQFDRFLREISEPVPSFDSPPVPFSPDQLTRLLAAAPKYGIELLPPPG